MEGWLISDIKTCCFLHLTLYICLFVCLYVCLFVCFRRQLSKRKKRSLTWRYFDRIDSIVAKCKTCQVRNYIYTYPQNITANIKNFSRGPLALRESVCLVRFHLRRRVHSSVKGMHFLRMINNSHDRIPPRRA